MTGSLYSPFPTGELRVDQVIVTDLSLRQSGPEEKQHKHEKILTGRVVFDINKAGRLP